jgi:hypothetical protein
MKFKPDVVACFLKVGPNEPLIDLEAEEPDELVANPEAYI